MSRANTDPDDNQLGVEMTNTTASPQDGESSTSSTPDHHNTPSTSDSIPKNKNGDANDSPSNSQAEIHIIADDSTSLSAANTKRLSSQQPPSTDISQIHPKSSPQTTINQPLNKTKSPAAQSDPKPAPILDKILAKPIQENSEAELEFERLKAKYPTPKKFQLDKKGNNLEERANIFDSIFFNFISPLIHLGFRRPLDNDDLYPLGKSQNCLMRAPQLEDHFNKTVDEANKFNEIHDEINRQRFLNGEEPIEFQRKTGSVSKASIRYSFTILVWLILIQGFSRTLQMCQPYVLRELLSWLANGEPQIKMFVGSYPNHYGYILALLLSLMFFCSILLDNIFFHQGYRNYAELKGALSAMVYTKALKTASFNTPGFNKAMAGNDRGRGRGRGRGGARGGGRGGNDRDAQAGPPGAAGAPPAATAGASPATAADVSPATAARPNTNQTVVAAAPGGTPQQSPPGQGASATAGQQAESAPAAQQGSGLSGIVNLISVDADKVGFAFFFGINVIFVPIQIAICLYLIYAILGPAIFVGFGVMVLIMPLSFVAMMSMAGCFRAKMGVADKRIRMTTEILQGIRVLKYQVWEYWYHKEISDLRVDETKLLLGMNIAFSIVSFVMNISQPLVTVTTFLVYASLNDTFDPVTVFSSVALINVMQTPLIQLPNSLTTVMTGLISARRLDAFFALPELSRMKKLDTDIISRRGIDYTGTLLPKIDTLAPVAFLDAKMLIENEKNKKYLAEQDSSCILENASLSWQPFEDELYPTKANEPTEMTVQRNVLHGINFTARKGKLTAIIGSVGCGKSSLVQALLQELTLTEGKLIRNHNLTFAYASQSAWYQTTTIRDNITWGQPIDTPELEERYQTTLSACALVEDLKQFDKGDLTEVGQVSLSGGQQQRLSLCRVCYSDCDVYIFDDVLSALDAHVSSHVFNKCILEQLNNKTRILITNQLHILEQCDYIYIMGTTDDPDAFTLVNSTNPTPAHSPAQTPEQTLNISRQNSTANSEHEHGANTSSPKPKPKRQIGIIEDHGIFSELIQRPLLAEMMEDYHKSLENKENTAKEKDELERQEQLKEIERIKNLVSGGSLPIETLKTATSASIASQNSYNVEDDDDQEQAIVNAENASTLAMSTDMTDPVSRIGELSKHFSSINNAGIVPEIVIGKNNDITETDIQQLHRRFETWERQARQMDKQIAEKQSSELFVGGTLSKGKQISTEEVATSSNTFVLLLHHFASMGNPVFITFTLSVIAISQGCIAAAGIVLSYWSDNSWNKENSFYFRVYGGLLGAAAFFLIIRGFLWSYACLKSSRYYHDRLLFRILRGNSTFFDTTPVGRIIGRFSSDLDVLDTVLPNTLLFTIMISSALIASLVSIGVLQPYFFIASAALLVIFAGLLSYTSRASVQLKRIDSLTRSPVLQHFTESVKGLPVIRAANKSHDFQEQFFKYLNANTNTNLLSYLTVRWVSLRVGLLVVALLLVCSMVVVSTRDSIDVGTSGAIITFVLSIGNSFAFLLTMAIEVFSRLSAIERLRFYTQYVPMEPTLEHGAVDVIDSETKKVTHTADAFYKKPTLQYHEPGEDEDPAIVELANKAPLPQSYLPPANISWPPPHWDIEIDQIWMKYREELPYVLRGLTLKIPQGTSVGVVGRTGSGKSSLLMLLLGMYPLQRGSIKIGGQCIDHLPLSVHRDSFAVIPQQPTLFSGTIRSNLDPFREYSDKHVLDALEQVGFKNQVLTMPGQLNATVNEFGSNLSLGERQLLCFARFLLRKDKVKILALDESTANISSRDDVTIQRMMSENFSESTILTIAHRIGSIINYKRILVLDKGTLAEYGPPQVLINAPTTDEPVVLPSNDPNDPTPIITRGIFKKMYQEYIKAAESGDNADLDTL